MRRFHVNNIDDSEFIVCSSSDFDTKKHKLLLNINADNCSVDYFLKKIANALSSEMLFWQDDKEMCKRKGEIKLKFSIELKEVENEKLRE